MWEGAFELSYSKGGVLIPVPKNNETKSDFIKRCIPYVIKEGKSKDQSVAICYSIWKNKNKKKNNKYNDVIEILEGISKSLEDISNNVGNVI